MRITAQTVLRFFGAAVLGFGATIVDQRAAVPKPATQRSIAIRVVPAPVPLSQIETIAPGKRAFSFPVNDLTGITGLLMPNSRVDVVAVVQVKGKGPVARVFMENVRVLSFKSDWVTEDGGTSGRRLVVTVEVTPEEGVRLAEATTQGNLQLLLRRWGDRAFSSPPPVTSAALTKR